MSSDGINDTVVRPGGPKESAGPELELRQDMRADAAPPAPVRDIALETPLPRDIAREPPSAPRAPLRDIARDGGVKEPSRDPELESLRERLREPIRTEPARDPLREMLQVAASREPPRQPPPPPGPTAANLAPPTVVAAADVTVRNPGLGWLAALIFLLGIIGGGLLAWQLNLLQGQMADLRATVTQNGKVADAASRLSDAAMQANEIANQSLANATRPWVGVDTVEASPIQAGQSLSIEVRVRNSGRTPSTDVQGLFLVYISPIDNPPALLTDQCASCVRSVMLPNGTASYKLAVRDAVMTADEVQRIKDGKDTMWIVGRLDYHDGEGELHTTRSCLYYRTGGIAAFTACSDGNAAN